VYKGADPGFVGPSYQAPMVLQSAQDTINFYLEKAPDDTQPKMPNALLACPGLNTVLTFTYKGNQFSAPVRGFWVLPGGVQALAVVSNILYLITIAVPATQTTIAVYTAVTVGLLQTYTGPVCIRDNGVLQNGLGGYAVIVDGTYGYYYLLNSNGVATNSYSFTLTGATTAGSAVITLPGSLPNGLIVGAAISSTSAYISGNIASVDTIGLTITSTAVAVATGSSVLITITVPIFAQITDAGFLGADRIAFIEGWLIFNEPSTRTFYTTGPTPYQLLFPGAFFSLKDSSTDNLVTLFEQDRELWLVGERTSEVWFNAGGTNFAFQRVPGVGPQIGCAAKNSITRCGAVLAWLGRNEQGQNVVVCTNQYTWQRISTHAVEHAIASYPVVSDAIGYGYEDDGHLFYMLTFPTADVTWCFDFTAGQWHKRLSYDPVAGVYHRHRSNCFMDFGDVRIVGDYQNAVMYQMSRAYTSDAGNPLRALRRTPPTWQPTTRERLFFSQFQIEFTPGVGLQTGQGSNPQVMLRWSDDGGFTWSNEHWATIGKAGATRNRAIWRQLGQSRNRVWELVITDPVPRDIIGATLYAEAS
jgi:hypothetical protein